jgi:hypothetical protein
MKSWKKRVIIEVEELADKINNLTADLHHGIISSKKQRKLARRQLQEMHHYHDTLNERIDDFLCP